MTTKKQTKVADPTDYESIYTRKSLYELDTEGLHDDLLEIWTSTFGRCISLGCYQRACGYHGYCEEHEQ